jgi:glycosyltransferase 2 family protein
VAGIVGTIGLCLLDRLPSHWRRWKMVRGLAQLGVDSRRVFVRSRCGMFALLIAFVGHINLSLSVWMLARGLNIHVSAFDCMVLIPPVTLIMILPVSIAGWGVRETAMVTAFGYVGVPGDSALALSILFGLVSLAASLPGGLCFLAARETSLQDIVVAPHDSAVDFFEDAQTAEQLSEAA